MAIFDRFRRNRQQSVLPDEVKQYYQAETRQRRGMALVLAVGALVATVAVAAGLFFGGRFIYDKVQGDDKKTAQKAKENQNGNTQDFGQVNTDTNQGQAPASNPAPATSTPSNPEPQTPTPTTATPQATPALGDTPAPLPHTGDEGL
jgi:hypothetical protein